MSDPIGPGPFPQGARCVITWCPWSTGPIGEIVTITDGRLYHADYSPHDERYLGMHSQRIMGEGWRRLRPGLYYVWPVAWMRRIDRDPDAEPERTADVTHEDEVLA